MGERTEIYLKNDNIYLYSHWDNRLILGGILKNALIRGKKRWSDRPYLNRIIFSEMIKDEILEETGYGLSNTPAGDGEVCFEVDVENNTVNGISFEEFTK
jgi:hypothetical protein